MRSQEIARRLATHNPDGHALVNIPLYVHRLNRKLRPYGLELDCLRGYGYRLHAVPAADRPEPASPLARPGAWPGTAGDANLLASWPPHGPSARV